MIPRLYFGRVVLITRSEPAIAFVRAIRFSTFSCFASIATRPRMPVSTRARSPNRSMSSRRHARVPAEFGGEGPAQSPHAEDGDPHRFEGGMLRGFSLFARFNGQEGINGSLDPKAIQRNYHVD